MGVGGTLPPEGHPQFTTLPLGNVVLAVRGMCGSASGNSGETLAADALGGFAGFVGANTIAGQGGGALVGPAGASWQDADGSYHAIVVGGIDLVTRLRRNGAWGF